MSRSARLALGFAACALFATAAFACAKHAGAPAAPPPPVAAAASSPPIQLSNAAPSVDALLAEFLDAVERKDTDALHRLRVTKEEYLQIIVPGTVAKGQPPRQISEQPREFFWALNDRKSRYVADALVERFGGRHFASHALRLTYGTKEYLWYTVHGQVRLDLRTPNDPNVFELRTGSIAEVDGRYKFLAFQWDD